MFLIESDANFKPVHRPNVTASTGDLLFIYDNQNIGLTVANELPVFRNALISLEKFYCFGHINEQQCLLWNTDPFTELKFFEAKLSYQLLIKELYQAVAIGSHIHHWRSAHRYCGKCAALMFDKSDEQALICSKCNHTVYPTISPCVIVLITRGEEMLLARSPHFKPDMMSTLAGFVTVGESLEQTVVREVKEEVGIEVGNLRYICSQPWPFPDSLMIGFTAEYMGGDIIIDKHEIEKAAWFNKDTLPRLPIKISIARHLIDMHLNKKSK